MSSPSDTPLALPVWVSIGCCSTTGLADREARQVPERSRRQSRRLGGGGLRHIPWAPYPQVQWLVGFGGSI